MKNKVSMKDFIPQKDDIIMLDTNIIIDLFYPINVGKDVSEIIALFQKIQKSKAKIIMSAVQISEFINRCIRFQFDLYRADHPECINFKNDYRSSEDYRLCMRVILDIINNEWKNKIEYVDDKFSNLDSNKIFIQNFAYDFNDAIIVEIANAYNAIFVTNDKDFMNYKIKNQVVSNNRFLLNVR